MLARPSEIQSTLFLVISCVHKIAGLLQFLIHKLVSYCQTTVLGLGPGVDFTFAWDNNNNNKNNDKNNPHQNFEKGTVLGDKEQGVGIRDKG